MRITAWLFGVLLSILGSAVGAETLSYTTYYHNDHLGSPVAATNAQGALLWRAHFRPYGERQEDPQSANYGSLGYTGHVQDADSGMVYAGARYYDPLIGRFMAIDPVGAVPTSPGSFNRYAYVQNSPYRYVDPNGESPLDSMYTLAVPAGESFGALAAYSYAKATGNAYMEQAAMEGMAAASDRNLAALQQAVVDAVKLPGMGAVSKVAKKADDYVDLASSKRRKHILDSDATGGGHRPGTGKPGKSEFPQGWSDDKIMHEISDVATDPNSVTRAGRGGRIITEGTRDGIDIRVIQERNGDIVSGFPTNVPRNP